MKIIEDAILKAVKDNLQDELLGKALIAWFNELSNGNESTTDFEAVHRRLNLLLQKTSMNLNTTEEDQDIA